MKFSVQSTINQNDPNKLKKFGTRKIKSNLVKTLVEKSTASVEPGKLDAVKDTFIYIDMDIDICILHIRTRTHTHTPTGTGTRTRTHTYVYQHINLNMNINI